MIDLGFLATLGRIIHRAEHLYPTDEQCRFLIRNVPGTQCPACWEEAVREATEEVGAGTLHRQ